MTAPPKLIFIVPYRNREMQRKFFLKQMRDVLADYAPEETRIYFAHQLDNRGFNRGAMKNIGFLAMKERYPEHYKNITFVFNDIDTMPYEKGFIHYETRQGIVKHFYGYTYALGGIVSITGGDFERINGFPNYWAWGYEDNLLNIRVKDAGITIDRSQFYPIMDIHIIQLKDGLARAVNRKEFDRYMKKTPEGLSSIQGVQFHYDEESHFIHVTQFHTEYAEDKRFTKLHDLRDGSRPFTNHRVGARRMQGSMKMLMG